MHVAFLAPYAHQVLPEADIAGLPSRHRGKVRDSYDLPDGRRILITTDRISAFDRPLAVVPFKGQVLNRMSRFGFEQTAAICPNHVIAYPDPNVVVARRLRILPVEIVVRGYLAGATSTSTSILTRYRAGEREMYGHRLPDGLRANEALRQAIVTPTTKAADGGHDEPLSAAMILERGLLSPEQWRIVEETALALFARGRELAAKRGLILADTKYEFGLDADGTIVLADEIHTPDSSRYWFAASYAERFATGMAPESFDKDFVRNWVRARCDPYHDPIPHIPREIVLEATSIYIRACEILTGEPFVLPEPTDVPMERLRRNLATYLRTDGVSD